MSSYYGVILHDYWDGETGTKIAAAGGTDALCLGVYLCANHRDNMIGLYRLRYIDITLPMTRARVASAFQVLAAADFARYDVDTSFVWVVEMARVRLGLQTKQDALVKGDNRIAFVNRLYDRVDDNPFLLPFWQRYHEPLHLKVKRRGSQGGSGAPPKPEIRSVPVPDQDQISTGSEIRDQGSDQEDLPPRSRRSVENLSKTKSKKKTHAPTPRQARGVATALRDCERPSRTGPHDRRRGVESTDPRPLGQIGFHISAAGDDHQGDVGSGAGVREAARPTPDIHAASQPATDAAVTAATQPGGGATRPVGLGGARPASPDAHDERRARAGAEPTEPDAGTDSRVAERAGDRHASAGPRRPGVDPNGNRMGEETPGQAELRRTIERLRRGHAR